MKKNRIQNQKVLHAELRTHKKAKPKSLFLTILTLWTFDLRSRTRRVVLGYDEGRVIYVRTCQRDLSRLKPARNCDLSGRMQPAFGSQSRNPGTFSL